MGPREQVARANERRSKGDYEAARRLADEAVGACAGEDPVSVDMCEALLVLGRAHQDLSDYAEAERLFWWALRTLRHVIHSEARDRTRIRALDALGAIMRIGGDLADSERFLREALALADEVLDAGDPQVAAVLDSLAGLYREAGHFDEAERPYRRALPILEGSLGADHPDVAGLYHDLAGLEHARGRHAAMPPRSRWPGGRSRSASVRSGPGTPTSPPTGRPWPAASWAPSARTTRPRPSCSRRSRPSSASSGASTTT